MDAGAIRPTPSWPRIATGTDRRNADRGAFADAFADADRTPSEPPTDPETPAPRRRVPAPPATGEIGPHHVDVVV